LPYTLRILGVSEVTYPILALNLTVYAYTAILSGNFMVISSDVLSQYGQSNYLVINGFYWRLFTAMFAHTNIVHLVVNMLFLIIFGLRAEELFSITEYLTTYLLSGLVGNLLTLLLGLTGFPGASGAIFSLCGACVTGLLIGYGLASKPGNKTTRHCQTV